METIKGYKELAKHLGVSERTLYRHSDKLPAPQKNIKKNLVCYFWNNKDLEALKKRADESKNKKNLFKSD